MVSFSHIATFYSERTRAQLWHIFIATLFYTSRTPKFSCFVCTDKITQFWPLQLATLVCSLARCGYLTPSLIAPKRTSEFLIFQASKIGFPQKGLFVSRSRRIGFSVSFSLFCFWLFFFVVFSVLVCRSVWLSSTLHYKTVFPISKTFCKKNFWG